MNIATDRLSYYRYTGIRAGIDRDRKTNTARKETITSRIVLSDRQSIEYIMAAILVEREVDSKGVSCTFVFEFMYGMKSFDIGEPKWEIYVPNRFDALRNPESCSMLADC